ncbi:mannonate dehydratase [Fibrella aestuarina BUZ 2]|uniref:Mannonate dehydratase n=1 Tax=Fibrella aestuarina BUZ 2 TaxID=1166018 RepID=I0KFB8_9BACT|nr:mannonate dehydratase [Fibrella aestuarina]CCH02821.1 mannonate dehydratase [Fibrella aestuarina BUZ 2]
MALEQTWRWFGDYPTGPVDPVSLWDVRQAGATGIVTALHHLPNGTVWSKAEIDARRQTIAAHGLSWSVIESIPVHEDIKKQQGNWRDYIANYKETLHNVAACGIDTVCYNFMPVLDWTRTDLDYQLPDHSTALRFDMTEFCAFDVLILQRAGAEAEYTPEVLTAARTWLDRATDADVAKLTRNLIAGLPGAEEGFTIDALREVLASYAHIDADQLRRNLIDFVGEIAPVAQELGIRLSIHPDDPPFPMLGLPRVMSTEADARALLDAVDVPANGLCFCTGSFGVRPDNDLVGMASRLADRIHFIHLRATRREADGSFYEADHLTGDVDMYGVVKALLAEQRRREAEGRQDLRMPFRPDHGHRMLDDLRSTKRSNPGYTAIGRLRGLAEIRGLMLGLNQTL